MVYYEECDGTIIDLSNCCHSACCADIGYCVTEKESLQHGDYAGPVDKRGRDYTGYIHKDVLSIKLIVNILMRKIVYIRFTVKHRLFKLFKKNISAEHDIPFY